ncbi:MAG TPA: hypothetical protein VNG90_04975 [Candidatus Acidoferrum sp.]|nr:hypothetical protein [Candidatus Acidoferrum sp.]
MRQRRTFGEAIDSFLKTFYIIWFLPAGLLLALCLRMLLEAMQMQYVVACLVLSVFNFLLTFARIRKELHVPAKDWLSVLSLVVFLQASGAIVALLCVWIALVAGGRSAPGLIGLGAVIVVNVATCVKAMKMYKK